MSTPYENSDEASSVTQSVQYGAAAYDGIVLRTLNPLVQMVVHPVDTLCHIMRLPFELNLKQCLSNGVQYFKGAVLLEDTVTAQERITRRFHLVSEGILLIIPVAALKPLVTRKVSSSKGLNAVSDLALASATRIDGLQFMTIRKNIAKSVRYIRESTPGMTLTETEASWQKSLIRLADNLNDGVTKQGTKTGSIAQMSSEATGWRAETLVRAVIQSEAEFVGFLECKIASNNGFDVVSVFGKSVEKPSKIRISEVKSAYSRPLKQPLHKELKVFKDGTRQMGIERIQVTLDRMLEARGVTRETAQYILRHWNFVELDLYGFEQASDTLQHLYLGDGQLLQSTEWLQSHQKSLSGNLSPLRSLLMPISEMVAVASSTSTEGFSSFHDPYQSLTTTQVYDDSTNLSSWLSNLSLDKDAQSLTSTISDYYGSF